MIHNYKYIIVFNVNMQGGKTFGKIHCAINLSTIMTVSLLQNRPLIFSFWYVMFILFYKNVNFGYNIQLP